MSDREPAYDPYIPSGGQNGGPGAGRTAALQAVSVPNFTQNTVKILHPLEAKENICSISAAYSLSDTVLLRELCDSFDSRVVHFWDTPRVNIYVRK